MSYGDTWPAPDPNELHIESAVAWMPHEDEPASVVHWLMRGDRMLSSRFTFQSILYQWRQRNE